MRRQHVRLMRRAAWGGLPHEADSASYGGVRLMSGFPVLKYELHDVMCVMYCSKT